jgi:23S rRNA-intervening sequence protein
MPMQRQEDNIILKKTIAFSLAIIEYSEHLEQEKKYVIARQLLKSGTSIGRTYMRLRMLKADRILFTSLKLRRKKLKKQILVDSLSKFKKLPSL